ncbi:hypothetical protein FGG08_005550 [Glutinoglossum americanum]|uniref:Uncharacterized protein n=1 Tax=Glutinoglossum americanum TaxID=1670608 RepID=A0A9P8I3D8_9PEZI|nr:hypothetical protein FGG08_005550 [Glutinoglossum americanum]
MANSTLATSAVTISAASDAGNQFTRANVVGMFLTLQLCQLTQPYGSLLFRGVSGFFWRCNPISSVVEACIIYWHLGAVVLRSWKEGRSAILKRLQEVSGGLLLLRGAIGKGDVGGLMQKLMTGSFLDKEEGVDTVSHNSHTVPDGQEGIILTEMQSDTRPSVSRRPTLEANRPPRGNNTLPACDPASEKSRVLREAFGSNALAHKEFRISLFTAFTELTIFIKLITVRGNGWFTSAGFFLIFGWSAVQTLLLLFHLRGMDEMEMKAAVRIARTINAELKEQADRWNALFIVLHLPFFGYPAYLASFHPWFSEHATGFVGFLRGCGWFLGILVSLLVAKFTFWGGLFGTFRGLAQIPGLGKMLFLLTFPVSCAWLIISSWSYFQQNCGDKSKYCVGNFTSFFEPQSPMYYIVDESFDVLYKGLWLLLFLALISIVYFVTVMPNMDSDTSASSSSASIERKMSSLGNALFVLVVFILYLIWYDPSKTSKPTWTEVLG